MGETIIDVTYTLKDTKKESNWSYEDGTIKITGRTARLRDEDGAPVGEAITLSSGQRDALESRGWLGGEATEDSEAKIKFDGTVRCPRAESTVSAFDDERTRSPNGAGLRGADRGDAAGARR